MKNLTQNAKKLLEIVQSNNGINEDAATRLLFGCPEHKTNPLGFWQFEANQYSLKNVTRGINIYSINIDVDYSSQTSKALHELKGLVYAHNNGYNNYSYFLNKKASN